MEILFIVLLALVVLGVVMIFAYLRRGRDGEQSLILIQNQLQSVTRSLDEKLALILRESRQSAVEAMRTVQHHSNQSAKILSELTEKLGRLDETNKQVVGFADQLQSLQDILQNPKQRGILGEYYLETALKNVLPPGSYQMQYAFKDGTAVDAVIFVQDKIIPIDSKFSLENYNRIIEAREPAEKKRYENVFVSDLKNRIDETSKYVKPEEDTIEFALMYVPSEAVYYDLQVNKVGAVTEDTNNLISYAYKKRVVIVGPATFGAFLQTILQGLKNQKISEQTKEIIKHVENLRRHLGSYEDYLQRLGKNLGAAVNMYNSAYKEFGKIDKDVLKISGKAIDAEPTLLDRPEIAENE